MNYDNRLISTVLAVLLFSFALFATSRNYFREKDPSRKREYLIQMIFAIILVIVFIYGMWYVTIRQLW
ncbi:MAG: hypothetical protein FWE76_08135 [Symbiobacteriaceae bacterium]|nr:hypothetical protein [Symbiobacteriaceae bacterium]